MTRYQNTVAAAVSAAAVLLAPAIAITAVVSSPVPAQAGARCPDQQMSESGPFQGRICKYGDWQVSHHHGDWRGLFDRPHFK